LGEGSTSETPTTRTKSSRARAFEPDELSALIPGHDRPVEERVRRWVATLGQEPGTKEQKAAWLGRQLRLIEDEAIADAKRDATRESVRARVRSLIVRWYRRHLENPDDAPRPRGGRGGGVAAAVDRIKADVAAGRPV
jgi:hypothetical protein